MSLTIPDGGSPGLITRGTAEPFSRLPPSLIRKGPILEKGNPTARIRSIKPELWSSDRFGQCSTNARLFFVASLNFADDNGNLDRSARQLKAQTLPYDSFDCEPLIQELIDVGLLIEYKVSDKFYLHIKNFEIHQKIDRPSKSRLPPYDNSSRTRRQLDEHSTSTRQNNLADGMGRDGMGWDGNGSKNLDRRAARAAQATDPAFEMLKSVYPKRSGGHRWQQARKSINARLAEGYTWQTILDAAQRYADWCRETGKERTETVKQAATFVGDPENFTLDWSKPAGKAEIRLAGNLTSAEEFMRRTEVKK